MVSDATERTALSQTPKRARLKVVRAKREQMDLIAGFVRSSADWYRPFLDPKDMAEHDVGEAWAEKNFARREFYIGYAGREPVGTLSIQCFGQWAYLGYIYLDVAHVGRGFGQDLMRYADATARQRGLIGLALIGHPKAVWAKRAYLRYGFHVAEHDKERVLAWNQGALQGYYEEGFELYLYPFDRQR